MVTHYKGDDMQLIDAVKERLAPLKLVEWSSEPEPPALPCVAYDAYEAVVALLIVGQDQWHADQAAGAIFRLLNGWLPPRDVPRLRVAMVESGPDHPGNIRSMQWYTLLRVEPKHFLSA